MCLPEDEIKLLKEAVEILRLFEAATTEMSAEKFVSISKRFRNFQDPFSWLQ